MATPQRPENAAENMCQSEDSLEQEREIPPPRIALRPKQEGGGYDCEFVDPPLKALQTECSICLQILREPHIISCCGHSFCYVCIERIQRDGKACPLCNEPSFTLMHNKGLQRTLREFYVRCTHQKAGCQWTGELEKLDQHLNVNPEPEKQLEGCIFTQVECLHCRKYLQRHSVKEHQEEQCPKRPCSCNYCRKYSSTYEDVEANHWPVCPCYPLTCPNECDSQHLIERQNLDHHLAKECLLQVVNCDFHYAGCEVRVLRKDMPQHLTKNFTHMSLLATLNQKLANQLLEKDEQNTRLTKELQQLTKKMEALDQLVTKLRGEQTRQQQNTEAKISHLEREQGLNQQKVDKRFDALPQTSIPQILMTDFARHKKNNDDWHSEPFYSHLGGYKMCLNVNANGYDIGKDTHVSVFVCLMRGIYDNSLKWPFRGDITIQLLNQLEDSEHHTGTINFTDQTPDECAGRVTRRVRGKGWGFSEFIPHSELSKYLKNDCFCFRVNQVDLK